MAATVVAIGIGRAGAGVVTHRAPRSNVHHLSPTCGHLRGARRVLSARQHDLWPGFVCETCRRQASCGCCGQVWPYCATRD